MRRGGGGDEEAVAAARVEPEDGGGRPPAQTVGEQPLPPRGESHVPYDIGPQPQHPWPPGIGATLYGGRASAATIRRRPSVSSPRDASGTRSPPGSTEITMMARMTTAEVLLDEGQVPEEVAGEDADGDPEDPADDVVGEEVPVAHLPDPGHEGGEGADDGDEAGDDDGLAPVLLVERRGSSSGGPG